MIARRRFLKLMGVGTAAAPLAAKAAADEATLKLMMSGERGLAANAPPPIGWDGETQDSFVKMAGYIRTFGLPKHIEEASRERARYVHFLDHDIACKRSWSLAVKIQEQRQRNYQRIIDGYQSGGLFEQAQRKFSALTGIRWQW